MEEENADNNLVFENENMTPEPQSSPILVDHAPSPVKTGGLDFSAGLSTMKYGLVTVLIWIPGILLIAISNLILYFLASEIGITILSGLFIGLALFISIMGTIQILVYPVSMALADGRTDGLRMGYIGSWKASGEMIIETISVLGGILLIMIIGYIAMDTSEGLGIFMAAIGGIALMLFMIGLIPYVVRKIASDMD
jgi:hypothetical protein|tara:strand:- start:29262 stop:29849 length:588 start_codon:yes stop_codon:yes gene_type:complete